MTQQRWEELLAKLRSQQWILQEDSQQKDETTVHTVIAKPPTGRIKLVFTIKPKFLGQHTTYSRRIGASVVVTPTYSVDEKVTVFELYRWVNNDWQRIEESSALSTFS